MRNWRVLIFFFALATAVPGAPWAQQTEDKELQELLGAPAAAPPTAGAATVRGSTVTGISNAFNPSIGIAGLLLGAGSDEGPAKFGVQEIEFVISSVIDPYFRVDIFLAVEEEFEVAGLVHGEEKGGGGQAEEPAAILEQIFVTATSLPQVTLRFGKFLLPFGKHNIMHRDQFPFVTSPFVVQETLGAEGLNEKAIDVAPLLPFAFFSELNLVAFQGDNEGLFHFAGDRGAPDKAKYLAHNKNLFDITDQSTIEFGLSYLSGTNNAGKDALTTTYGADLTFKQRPQYGRGRAGLTLQGEYIASTREAARNLESAGYYASAQWRFLEFWWIQGRYGEATIDELRDDGFVDDVESKHSDFLVTWVLSEFSVLRLQYSILDTGGMEANAWYLQFIFAMGAHPPHRY